MLNQPSTLDLPEATVPLVDLDLINPRLVETPVVSVGAGMGQKFYQLVCHMRHALL